MVANDHPFDQTAVESYISLATTIKGLTQSERRVLLWTQEINAQPVLPLSELAVSAFLGAERPVLGNPPHWIDDSLSRRIVNSLFREFYLALCRQDRRYKKEVAVLGENTNLLIGAVAGYIAASLGVAEAVIAATAAAIARLILQAGRNALCSLAAGYFDPPAPTKPPTAARL